MAACGTQNLAKIAAMASEALPVDDLTDDACAHMSCDAQLLLPQLDNDFPSLFYFGAKHGISV
jgi:hypothetical protein